MTESFATEFEKWLKSNPEPIDEEETDRQENNDGDGQDGFFGTHPDMSDQSESEYEDLKNLTDSEGFKSLAGPIEEQAPILLDDDFDDEGGPDNPSPEDRLMFLDEPPILEPVLQQQQSNMVSNVRGPQFSSTMRSYSRGDLVQPSSKKLVKRFRKAHSHLDASGHSLPLEPLHKSNHRQTQKLKESHEENIFEKFYSDQYDDSPPPLSPSPHAANIYSDRSDRKNSSYSPDFCAVEADSTSEINGSKVGSLYPSQRPTKNCQPGEILVECDSTCMLAVSPAIVSPASTSLCDMEEAPDCETVGKEKTKCLVSEECFDSFGVEQNFQSQWALSNKNCNKKSLLCKIKRKNRPQSHSVYKSDAQERQFWDESVDVEGVAIKKYDSFAINTRYNSSEELFCSPTVMDDAKTPQSLQHCHRFRQKRHTIDSPNNESKLRKRRHEILVRNTATDNFTLNDQPFLPSKECLSAVTPSPSHCHDEYSRTTSGPITDDCPRWHPFKKRRGKKLRRKTLLSSNLSDYYSHLPEDLQSFAIYTSQLSNVQARMHMLLTQLFPHFRNDLADMSPESSRFEMFLSDLTHTLEQPDECDLDNAAPPTLISYKDIKPTPVSECPELDTFKTDEEPCSRLLPSDSGSKAVLVSEELPSHLLPMDSKAAAESSKHIVTSNAIVSCPLSITNIQTCHASIPNCHSSHEEDDGKDIDIPLSQLSLEESVLTMPSKVILCRQSDESLRRFAKLSCRALQLLLPDLTISLCNELAQSPYDLMVFIDNIRWSNANR